MPPRRRGVPTYNYLSLPGPHKGRPYYFFMSNPYFRFKQFTVRHDRCAMKVGTDGCLLGAWVDVSGARRIADVGTGSGLIALMLAQRNADARIDALDIDRDACRQAVDNVADSPFASRIRIIRFDFRTYLATAPPPYDLIVSNPPYFDESLKCPDARRTTARHTDTLPTAELLRLSAALLTDGGRLALILPYAQRESLLQQAVSQQLHLIRETRVVPVAGAPPKRLLVEFSRRPSPCVPEELTLETPAHDRTEAFRRLVRDFYLK